MVLSLSSPTAPVPASASSPTANGQQSQSQRPPQQLRSLPPGAQPSSPRAPSSPSGSQPPGLIRGMTTRLPATHTSSSSTTGPPPHGLTRGMSSRSSFISKLTPFQSRTVSVVPFAPERLSISQTIMTPAMTEAIIQAGIQAEKRASATATMTGEQALHPPNTLMAALRMRKALRRPRSGLNMAPEPVDEVQENVDRHKNVLARYKIRRVDFVDSDSVKLKSMGWLMVNPNSTLYKMWQLTTLLLIIYQSLILPYALAFGASDSNTTDVLISCVFATDILIQFNTPIAPTDDVNTYITNRRAIAIQYIRGWLFFDVIACIPFDYVLLLINDVEDTSSGATTGNLNILGLLKALRAPRLLRLVRLLRVVKIFKIRPELRRWLQYSRHANLLRLVRLVLLFLVVNHYVACIWYGGVASDEFKSQDASKDSLHLYFASFYMSILVVMGQNITIYDDTEYVFCIIVMVLGAVLMAVVFGNVAILIANYYESQSSHQKKMEWLFASMNRMKLPNELQNRINDYYQAMWERHGTLDGAVTAFIPELSRNLAYEVELFLRMDMINRAPIFQSCSAKVVQELVMELELQVFMPGDYVVVRGEVGNDMYFVQNGVCEVTKDMSLHQSTHGTSHATLPTGATTATSDDPFVNELVLKVLGQGDYFGEIALLMNCKRTANVRAASFSELCTLTRDVFESISLRYLEDRTIIEKFIMDKYDPKMMQAALKQSKEVGKRVAAAAGSSSNTNSASNGSSGSHSGGSSGAQPLGAAAATECSTTQQTKLLELLQRMDDRLQRLESRIDRDASERRDSDARFQLEYGFRTVAASRHPSVGSASRHPSVGSASASSSSTPVTPRYVAFEPDRMSQRNILAPSFTRAGTNRMVTPEQEDDDDNARDRVHDEVVDTTTTTTTDTVIDGIATPDAIDEKKVWKRPELSRQSGSWRNARREGSVESLRLRGLVKPLGSTSSSNGNGSNATRQSSHASAIATTIAAADLMATHHSQLRNEPPLRGPTITLDTESDDLDHDYDFDHDAFSTDVTPYADLERKLSQIEQRYDDDDDDEHHILER